MLAAVGASPFTAPAQTTNHLTLRELAQTRLPDVVLSTVTWVAPDLAKDPGAKGYVEVKGIIGGNNRFELLLPEEWNGKFVMGGGGGFVGSVQNMARSSVRQGYATVGTDTGHETTTGGVTAVWALDDVEAKLNFGYLAVHRTAETAKGLIRAYYGKEARYSYFEGCSRGGGQALMEAQRFPKDFDGIVAGAPAFDWTGIAAMAVSISQKLYPDPKHLERGGVSMAVLQKLQKAIIDQCDAQDGLKDGVIQDPLTVHFDLAKVPELTDEQRKAIEAIYAGARNDKGLIYPGYTAGAECDPGQWVAWITGPVPPFIAQNHAPDLMFAFGTQIFKYLIFNDADWDYSTYSFSHFEKDARLGASYLNATNSDLTAFKSRKGKLVIWHGWADPALPAQATADYYDRVLAHDPKAPDYCRLFMVPGCLHCGGGPGASDVDWLKVIADWVEHGQAPDEIIASKRGAGRATRTRPLYPYPETALYKGSGDPDSAASFGPKSQAKK
jgi:feruloyl esterase